MVATASVKPITVYAVLQEQGSLRKTRITQVCDDAARDRVEKEWRETIRFQPPTARRKFLDSTETIAAMGAAFCAWNRRELDMHERRVANTMPGEAWLSAWKDDGLEMPSRDNNHQGGGLNWRGCWKPALKYAAKDAVRCRGKHYEARRPSQGVWPTPGQRTDDWWPTQARQHAARMILGHGLIRYGDEGRPAQRWTPPQAVNVEDLLDDMGDVEAIFYQYPASPSAVAIRCVVALGKATAEELGPDGKIPRWLLR